MLGVAWPLGRPLKGIDGATTPARIRVDHGDREQVLLGVVDPVREVSRLRRTCADASDVTISIKLPDDHGTLLVALQSGSAFVGLRHRTASTTTSLTKLLRERQSLLGAQPTAIDARYVLAMPTAIELLAACLAGRGRFAAPAWGTAITCDNGRS